MKLLLLFPCLLAAALMGQTSEVVRYKVGDSTMASTLVLPANATAEQTRPAVLIVPNWMGPGPYYDAMAQEFARNGIVAMTVDMYGEGVRPANLNQAAEAASVVGAGDRSMMRNRITSAVKEIRNRPEVDKQRIVAIGFSFGGTAALELARSGSTINGVVSFHGGLSTPLPEDNRKIKTSLLVLQGSRDPYVPLEEVLKFLVQMRDTDVDWTFVEFSKATHAFTNPAANQKGKEEFDEKATLQSWEMTFDFIGRRLKVDTTGLNNRKMLDLLKKAAIVEPVPAAQPAPATEATPAAAE
ncbi:MAG: dienelactone hydrolase family protein [Verrucomicrobiota bacterium JB022]|nr:dienelactone hydrolase family protein [Verrucomicrobiota bacterium JB022]